MGINDYNRDTNHDWEEIARSEPYYGVLTSDSYKKENLSVDARAEFFNSGEMVITNVMQNLNNFDGRNLSKTLDFGAGVGRLVMPMSKFADKVVAVEISDSMKNEMLKNLRLFDIHNVNIYKTIDEVISSLDYTGGFDWINSYIVFQHIPPNIGYEILDKLLSQLSSQAFISLHFNIYQHNAEIHGTLQQIDAETIKILDKEQSQHSGMRMYDYDLNRILRTLLNNNILDFNVYSEDHGSFQTVWIMGRNYKPAAIDTNNAKNPIHEKTINDIKNSRWIKLGKKIGFLKWLNV